VATRFGQDMVDPMNTLAMMLPGTAITYNGEEIGMADGTIRWAQTVDPFGKNGGMARYEANSRDPFRTPFHWNDFQNAGKYACVRVVSFVSIFSTHRYSEPTNINRMNRVQRLFDVSAYVASSEQQLLVSQLGLSKGMLQKPLSDVQNAVATPFISDSGPRKSHHAHAVRLGFDFD